MGAFDRFWKREELLKKSIEIDVVLYEKLEQLAKYEYQTSTNQLINACIEELLQTEDIGDYNNYKKQIKTQHSLLIRKSLFDGLEELSKKYGISIYKLVNNSIDNALKSKV